MSDSGSQLRGKWAQRSTVRPVHNLTKNPTIGCRFQWKMTKTSLAFYLYVLFKIKCIITIYNKESLECWNTKTIWYGFYRLWWFLIKPNFFLIIKPTFNFLKIFFNNYKSNKLIWTWISYLGNAETNTNMR